VSTRPGPTTPAVSNMTAGATRDRGEANNRVNCISEEQGQPANLRFHFVRCPANFRTPPEQPNRSRGKRRPHSPERHFSGPRLRVDSERRNRAFCGSARWTAGVMRHSAWLLALCVLLISLGFCGETFSVMAAIQNLNETEPLSLLLQERIL
jgi:hypothetical protein